MDEQKYREFNEQVELGAQICIKLKQIYYPHDSGYDSYRKIADKLTQLKQKARLVLAHLNEVEMLKTLRGFSHADLREMLDEV